MGTFGNTFGLMGAGERSGGIPFQNDALLWLDGTILNSAGTYYFVDKKSGKNFLITGYDFPTDWTKGFPYKSAATISAPAGDATLIAADINSFLYTGGTPNQIPVISLFQNIDYANKIFCRHGSPALDGDGVETYEARVEEIALYNSALVGANLSVVNTYYEVPVEDIAAKWVSKTGNDTSGNGSKASPYLTIEKAYKTFTTGVTIYVTSGIYTEEYNATTIRYFYADKAGTFTIKGLGLCEMRSIDVTYVLRIIAPASIFNFTGFILNGEGNTTQLINNLNTASNKVVLNYCCLKGATSRNIFTSAGAGVNEYEVSNCIFLGDVTITTVDGSKINNSLIYGFCVGVTEFKYNKLRYSGTAAGVTMSGLAMSCKYNDMQVKRQAIAFYAATVDSTADIKYNKLNILWNSSLAANVYYIYINNQYIIPTIEFNQITQLGAGVTDYIYLIYIGSVKNPIVRFNRFNIESKTLVSTFSCAATETFIGIIRFNYNYIHSNKIDGADVTFGGETTVQNHWNGSEFIGNRYIGYKRNFPAESVGVSVHAIFIGASVNNIIKDNYISETGLGLVVKTGLQQAYTSGGIFYNLFSDCRKAIWMRGVGGINVFNNTFYHSNNVYGSGYDNAIYADENSTALGNFCENIILRNNIYKIYGSLGNANVVFDEHAATNGCIISDENMTGGSYALQLNVAKYSTIALAQAVGQLMNSSNTEPNLNSELIPAAPITGANLGPDYNNGLDISTNWGSNITMPIIVNKQQNIAWERGAYIH